ncbi:unnamed protein product [Tetraodon nigroviridis]|uniref:(spotted green pufferfish) hypothetical protein n=1 Tax=Tetraodon nigroviridis TaxID=99883 RepID=Q4RP09_TETNG|nr:unnamed protein product [Tetraodon nigroviridis]
MRSKSDGMETRANGVLGVPQGERTISQEEEMGLPVKKSMSKVQQQEDEDKVMVVVTSDKERLLTDSSESGERKADAVDLSRKDLLKLLGIMEGEVQAREDVIYMLKSKPAPPEALESRYGSTVPGSALQALQRDGVTTGCRAHSPSVYQKPVAELERLQEKHKETYRRMLGQLLMAEKCHRRTIQELDTEKRKHADYMNKSDEFTNLLEQERESQERVRTEESKERRGRGREMAYLAASRHSLLLDRHPFWKPGSYIFEWRTVCAMINEEDKAPESQLKKLLENEKAYQAKKEKEHSKRLEKVREELVKLKSFALMLVTERQQHLEQMDQESQRVQELGQQLQQRDQALSEARERAREDRNKVLNLEAELKEKSTTLTRQQEEMNTKLASVESHNRQLSAKLLGVSHKMEELEENNRVLKTSEEELQELREKISKGECGNTNVIAELENLRKRVLEMEGKDEEITKTENQCKELRKKLQEEDSKSKDLRLEVENLQNRMVELEKLEGTFTMSKAECAQLHTTLERETGLTKELSDEVVALRIRMKELESSELKLEKSELSLKDDMSKLKALTVALMEERKTLVERLKSDEKKNEDLSKLVKSEQGKVMEVTEKLIEESKKLLRLKSEMETAVEALTLEKGELSTKLAYEMDKTKDLNLKLSQMKKRLDGFEQADKLSLKNNVKCDLGRMSDHVKTEDNKVKELTCEIEHLKNRLKQLEVVEGDLMKTEDQYDMLEKRFMTEQDKAKILSKQVEEMRSLIARNKAIEKGEEESQEEDLRQRCTREEAKTRQLQADVVALKEKIHELMHKEDQVSQLQVDYSILQQRFLEEEGKAKSMSSEVLQLTKELEMAKRHSRALRPSLNGRRMMDVAVTSTGVQTEASSVGSTEEETPAVFIRKSVQEENHIMNNLRLKSLKKPTEKSGVERSPSSSGDLGIEEIL